MKEIIERKNIALENLYKKMNSLIEENHELRITNPNKNILDKKVELLKSSISPYLNDEIDKLIDKYIIKGTKTDISLLLELCYLYYEEKNRLKFRIIIDEIIDNYLNDSLSEVYVNKIIDVLNKVNIDKNRLFKIINKVINNGIISMFESYIIKNKESLYIFKSTEDSIEIIKKIIDVLIINQEIELQLGYKELFKVMNNHLNNIEVNNLSVEVYADIILLSLYYREDCNAINEFNISVYEYSKEIELIELILSGIEDLYFDEYRILKLSNNRQKYLIPKIIENTFNLNVLFEKTNKQDSSMIEAIDNKEQLENKINIDTVVQTISLINDNEKYCKFCSEKYIKEKVWLSYYTDKNQEKYNGVIPATLFKCNKCNEYYAFKRYIEALEKDLDGDVIITK